MRRSLLLLPLLCAGVFAAAVRAELAPPPLEVVPELDLGRYAGTWHEIARLPIGQEEDCVAAIAVTYTLQADRTLAVRHECIDANGDLASASGIVRQAGDDPAKLEIRFVPNWLGWVPFVWSDYWVIAIDEDYRWAIVGEPGRHHLWFLARDPVIDVQLLESMKGRARTHGYDLDELIVNPASAPE